MQKFPNRLLNKLTDRRSKGLLRNISTAKNVADFASNDYLGLSKDQKLYGQALKICKQLTNCNGATGSRLLTGNSALYEKLENQILRFHGFEDALVFNSGYDANLGFFSSVPQRGDVVLYDAFIHASIRDGIRLTNAKSQKFKHNNLQHLRQILGKIERTKNKEIYVVTESVFSMDGDSPNLPVLASFCQEANLRLVVDEAHAFGVFGKGLVANQDLQDQVFATLVTFGKAMGCHGAAVLGSTELRSYLLNFARSLVFTTALPPHALASILVAYKLFAEGQLAQKQERLAMHIREFKKTVIHSGLQDIFIPSNSAIQCVVIPSNEVVNQVSEHLIRAGFDVRAIRSPTVEKGKERLRFCLHSYNTVHEISSVLKLLKSLL